MDLEPDPFVIRTDKAHFAAVRSFLISGGIRPTIKGRGIHSSIQPLRSEFFLDGPGPAPQKFRWYKGVCRKNPVQALVTLNVKPERSYCRVSYFIRLRGVICMQESRAFHFQITWGPK